MAWQVGNEDKVRIGENPWIGVRSNFRLSEALVESLHEQGIYSLREGQLLCRLERTNCKLGTRKFADFLNLQGELAEEK